MKAFCYNQKAFLFFMNEIKGLTMENKIHLSKRLLKVASFIQDGAILADIGSDHAYLPCYVCLNDKSVKAIAGEVNKGPYESAVRTVESYNLTHAIDVRLGNGLEVITLNDSVDHIVIAGMGGSLIKDILEAGKNKLKTVQRIIAQPNVDARNVRKWLVQNHFQIIEEEIIEENDHIYEIIVADRAKSIESLSLTEKEFLFGPKLLEQKNEVFYKKWSHESEKLHRIVTQMKQAKVLNKEKVSQFEEELNWMREVLVDE